MRTDIDVLSQIVRSLPVRDRLRLVERVIHDLAETPAAEPLPPSADPYPIGLFADDPDGVDAMMEQVMEMRRGGSRRNA